jgi:hypothetical protein
MDSAISRHGGLCEILFEEVQANGSPKRGQEVSAAFCNQWIESAIFRAGGDVAGSDESLVGEYAA